MKNIAILGLFVAAFGMFGARGLAPKSMMRSQTGNARINVKDLSESGLSIVPSIDSTFAGLVSNLLRGRTDTIVDTVGEYSVFLNNNTQHSVVACVVTWEIVNSRGQTITWKREFTNLLPLMDKTSSEVKEGFLLRPRESWFISPSLHQVNQEARAKFGDYDDSVTDDLNESLAELTRSVSITISLNGAFFEDGSFIGSDSNFFDRVKAMRNGRRDAFLSVVNDTREGKDSSKVFSRIVEWASNHVELNRTSSASDYYEKFKGDASAELLRRRKVDGDSKTIGMVLRKMQKPWPELRRVTEK